MIMGYPPFYRQIVGAPSRTKMGEWKGKFRRPGIMACSSYYAGCGHTSERVMSLIESMVASAEIYFIDECFADLTGVRGDLTQLGNEIRAKVLNCTGIPVGSLARTKTLAKLANHTANRLLEHAGGVVNMCEPFKRDWVLRNTEVKEVWGISRRMTAHLEGMGL